MTDVTRANREWCSRPDDQKFRSFEDFHAACRADRASAKESKHVPYAALKASDVDGEVIITGARGTQAKLTNWSFAQLCARIEAPAAYLRKLTPDLAATNVNAGLARITSESAGDREAKLLLRDDADGAPRILAFTSDRYTRIWDVDVADRLERLMNENPVWQPAPAAFDGSRGLYKGPQDCFAFFVDNNRRIFETNGDGGLSRGFFVWNSQVGAATFGVLTFLYQFICGNHNVWGSSGVRELNLRHVGNADSRAFTSLQWELKAYAESSATDDEAKIRSARTTMLGGSKDEVLDKVFGLRAPGLTRKLITEGYDRAEQHSDWYGSPRSVWGLTSGLTEIARDLPHADARVAVERAAGRVMQVAF